MVERNSDSKPKGENEFNDELDPLEALENARKQLKDNKQENKGLLQQIKNIFKKTKPEQDDGGDELTDFKPLDLYAEEFGDDIQDIHSARSQDSEIFEPESRKAVIETVPEPEIMSTEQKAEKKRQEPVLEDLRDVALEGFVEGEHAIPEMKLEKQVKDTVSQTFKNIRLPGRPMIWVGIALVLILLIWIGGLNTTEDLPSTSASHSSNNASNSVNQTSVPYPEAIRLPGGWDFSLKSGEIEEGLWNPDGPEWLKGTEICRWVALPWSVQLEAVAQTLTRGDEIILTMSNLDRITYRVQSIAEIDQKNIEYLDRASPCLHVILVNENENTRLVITAALKD